MFCSCKAVDTITSVNDKVNGFVWGWFGVILLVGTGIVMTVLTKVFQISHIGHWFKETLGSLFNKHVTSHSKDMGSISQFQALCTALAATIGVGNIAGVAAAIVTGGPGAIFWMWVAAFFGMMTNFSENVLGIFYRRKNSKGEWSGGAMYYLRDGLGAKKHCKTIGKILAGLFAVFALLASFGIGNMGQVNKIVANFAGAFPSETLSNVPVMGTNLYNIIIGIVLMIIAALIIIGGLQRIASFAEKIVPFMVVLFVLGSLIIIGVNYSQIGAAFGAIFENAFTANAAWGGAGGFVLATVIQAGFKRGVFSNEAGLGSSVMVHSNSNVKEPVKQGIWGIFEVFADTMVVCTMTALVILTSGVIDLKTGMLAEGTSGDATLVAKAFDTVFSVGNVKIGSMFIAIAILLFAFTTVLGWSHYGTKAWEYLFGTKSTMFYKIVFVLMIMSGAVMTSSLAWDISDTFNGLMMIPNLIGVLSLSTLVMKITKNYVDRRIRKKEGIKPMLSFDNEIQLMQEAALKADLESGKDE
ncbi:MAG: sodium:alanine symporter family protein [Acutalibacteraceae bacterium]|nr:sodium:alanine symporter family protein [Acutalibacteraceae bacterium]